ncbi:MAG: hypothetical protein BGO12_03460 [Verrucomicrobia bacterium 61-8]|nr:MAG: hypothetical protein BGO12_03460 [Verrucomicrobia bacterium 61-8]
MTRKTGFLRRRRWLWRNENDEVRAGCERLFANAPDSVMLRQKVAAAGARGNLPREQSARACKGVAG